MFDSQPPIYLRQQRSHHKLKKTCWASIMTITWYIFATLSCLAIIITLHVITIPLRIGWRYNASDYARDQMTNNRMTNGGSALFIDFIPQHWFSVDEKDLSISTRLVNSTNQPSSIPPHSTSHPFAYPHLPYTSKPIQLDSDITTFNVSIQPLPPNPKGYKYFSTRRLFIKHPPQWSDAFPDPPSQHQGIATCFSDWIPTPLIAKMEQEDIAKQRLTELKEETSPLTHISTTPPLTTTPPLNKLKSAPFSDKRPIYGYINMTRINLDELATYYGYKTYDEMPYHPRVPTQPRSLKRTTAQSQGSEPLRTDPNPIPSQVKWELRCITPWKIDTQWSQDHNPDYYVHFYPHRGFGFTGPEDNRLWYDRCGRLLSIYGKYNNITPIMPNWGLFVLDSRRFETDLLIKPFEFCEAMYQNQTMAQHIRNHYDGHSATWEKNHHELPYGFSLSDITAMVAMRNLFQNAANYYSPRTNSYYLTQSSYDQIKSALMKPIQTRLQLDGDENLSKEDQTKLYDHPIRQWVNADPIFVRGIGPFRIAQGSVLFEEQIQPVGESSGWKLTEFIKRTYPSSYNSKTIDDSRLPKEASKSAPQTPSRGHTQSLPPQDIPPPIPFPIHYPSSTFPTGLNPHRYIADIAQTGNRFNGIDPNQSLSRFQSCMRQYNNVRANETGLSYQAKTNHGATNALLLYITDEQWGFSPASTHQPQHAKKNATTSTGYSNGDHFAASTPILHQHQDTHPSWVYLSIHHERSTRGIYRAVVFFVNAITLELFAIQPVHWDVEEKCAIANCQNGLGTTCGICRLIYTHGLMANSTPMSFSILDEVSVGTTGKVAQQSLHTALPTFHSLDSQFFAVLNVDDKFGWLQELNIRSLWYNRFSCDTPPIESDTFSPDFNADTRDLNHQKMNNMDRLLNATAFHFDTETPPPTRHSFYPPRTVNDDVIADVLSNPKGHMTPGSTPPLNSKGSNGIYNQGSDLETTSLLTLREIQKRHIDSYNDHTPTSPLVTDNFDPGTGHNVQSATHWFKHDWSKDDTFPIHTVPYSTPNRLFFFLPRVFEFYNFGLHYTILNYTMLGAFAVLLVTFFVYQLNQICFNPSLPKPALHSKYQTKRGNIYHDIENHGDDSQDQSSDDDDGFELFHPSIQHSQRRQLRPTNRYLDDIDSDLDGSESGRSANSSEEDQDYSNRQGSPLLS